MLEPSTLEKCADLSVYDIFISALTLEYSNLSQQDSSKHENHDDAEYGEFLSETTVDEFGVITDSINDDLDLDAIMRQDRVIRILDKFCKLFLDRKQIENSADEESAEPAKDFSTLHNVILSCKFNSAKNKMMKLIPLLM